MTSHELANKLLEQSDRELLAYSANDGTWNEVVAVLFKSNYAELTVAYDEREHN